MIKQTIKKVRQLRRNKGWLIAAAAMLLLGSIPSAMAQTVAWQDEADEIDDDAAPVAAPLTAEQEAALQIRRDQDHNFVTLSYENDLIGSGRDGNYTSGIRATWFNVNTEMPELVRNIADELPLIEVNETTSTFYSVGQNLFTPDDITIEQDQPGERPWAAFLYGSAGITTVENNHIDQMELTLGVVGPEALGKQTQRFIHSHVTDSPDPRGWKNQIKTEPGLMLSAERRWPNFYKADIGTLNFRAAPNVNATVGNIYTYAGTGMNFTLGPSQEQLQDTPPRVRPAMPGSGYFQTPSQGWSWFLFAGVEGRAVARNIFLDGNTFEDSARVDKKYFVGDANAGIALTYDDYRLSYSYTYRTKEYDSQDEDTSFGAISLGMKF